MSIHLDTYPYLNPDGNPNLKRAAERGIYDLAPWVALGRRRTSRFTARMAGC